MKVKNLFYTILIVVHIIFIVLFFDMKVHVGGDDSDYIIAAVDFLDGRSFPAWHGSLYPIFLSPFVAIFGIDVVWLKLTSVLLVVSSFYFLHKAFYKHLPVKAYNFALAITACSYGFAVYASTTYSEPLFLFFQSLVLLIFVKVMDKETMASEKYWKWTILLSFFVFCLSLTRNIGFGALVALAMIFCIEQRWKVLAIFAGSFAVFQIFFSGYKKTVWNVTQAGLAGQFDKIKYKDFYDPNKGTEDVAGFISRFWDNANLYLSKHMAGMIGIRPFAQTVSLWITILFFVIFIAALISGFKKNRVLLFMTLYVGVMLAVTFITQQTHWDQERLVMVYVSLVAAILGCLLNSLSEIRFKVISVPALIILFGLPSIVFLQTVAMPKNIFYSLDALHGKKYSGYPQEWKNYSEMTEWVGANISEDQNVLCRKSGIASVYGSRRFNGISHFYDTLPDKADAFLMERDIRYVILDDLQMPTVKRMLTYYLMKYPFGLEVVKSFGTEYPSVLLKVCRDAPVGDDSFLKRASAGITVCPNDAYFYAALGDRFAQLRNFETAFRYYSTALTMKGKDVEKINIQFQRAKVLIELRQLDKAQKEAEEIVTRAPTSKNSWHLLAYIHQIKGNEKEAQKYYKKSLSL